MKKSSKLIAGMLIAIWVLVAWSVMTALDTEKRMIRVYNSQCEDFAEIIGSLERLTSERGCGLIEIIMHDAAQPEEYMRLDHAGKEPLPEDISRRLDSLIGASGLQTTAYIRAELDGGQVRLLKIGMPKDSRRDDSGNKYQCRYEWLYTENPDIRAVKSEPLADNWYFLIEKAYIG